MRLRPQSNDQKGQKEPEMGEAGAYRRVRTCNGTALYQIYLDLKRGVMDIVTFQGGDVYDDAPLFYFKARLRH